MQNCSNTLRRDFFHPPFSVFDARQGWWQQRKRQWLSLGIDSGAGRPKVWASMDTSLAIKQRQQKTVNDPNPAWSGTSVFDPVLCETVYRWFCPAGGKVFDPFAGGSVRGIVASALGLPYIGLDVRAEQIRENDRQAKRICSKPMPRWRLLDACTRSLYRHYKTEPDLIFTCPPYADLEVYSSQPDDISTWPYDTFAGALKHSIKQQASRLKDNRFAVYVIGDVRDKRGHYRGLPQHVTESFREAGMALYNEIVLLTSLGTLPVRVRGMFDSARKVGRAHQIVQVYIKGDPAIARADLGELNRIDPFEDSM